MNGHRFPNPWDISLLADFDLDHAAMVEASITHIEKPRPPWDYLEFVGSAPAVIQKCRSRLEAEQCCGHRKHEEGNRQNRIMAGIGFDHLGGRGHLARPIKPVKLAIANTEQALLVRPAALLLADQEQKLLIPQCRKNGRATPHQWSFFHWMNRRVLSRTQFATIPLIYLDGSADSEGVRSGRLLGESQIPVLDDDFAVALYRTFYRAFIEAASRVPPKTKPAKAPKDAPLIDWLDKKRDT